MGRIILSLRFLVHTLIVIPLSFFTGKKVVRSTEPKLTKALYLTAIDLCGLIFIVFREQFM